MATKVSEDVSEVWVSYKRDQTDQELRNRLMERYLPLVRYNAERVWAKLPEGVDLNDLMSAGVFGLMDAIEAFDMERGVKFETYCVPRIRGAMLDELRTMDWVPRLVRSKASKVEQARKAVEARVGRPPTEAEIAEQMSVGNFKRLSKQDLIYKILDQQALTPGAAEQAEAAPVAAAPASVPRTPAKAAARRPAPSTTEQPFSDVAPPAASAAPSRLPSRPPREPRREALPEPVVVATAPEATVEIFDSIEGLALVPANHATGAALANEPVAQLAPEPAAALLNGHSVEAVAETAQASEARRS